MMEYSVTCIECGKDFTIAIEEEDFSELEPTAILCEECEENTLTVPFFDDIVDARDELDWTDDDDLEAFLGGW